MEQEHEVVVIPVDDRFDAEIARMKAEGWQLLKAFSVYHVTRAKPQPLASLDGIAKMTIDDSKVGILRNGQIVG